MAVIVILLSLAIVYWKNSTGESGYGFSTTAEQVAEGIDLSGKVAIITGANGGLGFETARVLAWNGAKVFVLARSQEKADKAVSNLTELLDEKLKKKKKKEASEKTEIEDTNKKDDMKKWDLVPMVLELDSFRSIENFANQFLSLKIPLHYLINNAAAALNSMRTVTKDGFEMNMGVNHIGHFYLTNLLLEKLKDSAPSRIVILSSDAVNLADNGFLDEPEFETKPYGMMTSYANSKLANVYHAVALNNRLANTNVTTYSLHPGTIVTGMGRNLHIFFHVLTSIVEPFMFKNIKQGAATQIYAALKASESDSGKYFRDCNKVSMEFATSATNVDKMNAFWEKSQRLIMEKISPSSDTIEE